MLLGATGAKAVCKYVDEIDPGLNFINILRALFCRYFGTKNYKAEKQKA